MHSTSLSSSLPSAIIDAISGRHLRLAYVAYATPNVWFVSNALAERVSQLDYCNALFVGNHRPA